MTEPDSGPETGTESTSPNSEAARYRVRLRETETERDGLREEVNGYLRADATRIAESGEGADTPRLRDGSDLFTFGVKLDDLLDEAGKVDEAKVREQIEAVTDGRDHLRGDKGPQRPKPDLSQGSSGTDRRAQTDRGSLMQNLLRST